MAQRPFFIAAIILICMLSWALVPTNPYAYYTLLRWVCLGGFGYLFTTALHARSVGWMWVFGISALLYNPISTVHLNRFVWSIVNIATIIVLITAVIEKRRSHQPSAA